MAKKKQVSFKEKVLFFLNDIFSANTLLFMFGLFVCFVAPLVSLGGPTASRIIMGTLIILGLVIGVLNISRREVVPFLVSIMVLVMMFSPFLTALSQVFTFTVWAQQYFGALFSNLIAMLVPAGIVVSLRTMFATAKDDN